MGLSPNLRRASKANRQLWSVAHPSLGGGFVRGKEGGIQSGRKDRAMNFDDTDRFFGPSEKLWPELFAPRSKKAAPKEGQFLCLICSTPIQGRSAMQVTGGRPVETRDRNGKTFSQWNCPRCGFFYKPLVARTIPKQYQAKLSEPSQSVTRLCLDCRRVVVSGIKRYCAKCLAARQRKIKRESARKRRSNVDKTKNSLIGTQTLTHTESRGRYDHPQTSFLESEMSTQKPQERGAQ